jgi:purine-binding chemotaxis protein CheW
MAISLFRFTKYWVFLISYYLSILHLKESDRMDNNIYQEEDTQHGRYLTFTLGNEAFGLEIIHVTEIVGVQPITPIPEVPSYIKGVINLRGKIIPVIDVRMRFGREPMAYDDRTCIIVVDILDICVGLIVDQVAEVITIDDANIVPPPDWRTGVQNRYIKAIGKVGTEVKLLLDCDMLFKSGELSDLENIG